MTEDWLFMGLLANDRSARVAGGTEMISARRAGRCGNAQGSSVGPVALLLVGPEANDDPSCDSRWQLWRRHVDGGAPSPREG